MSAFQLDLGPTMGVAFLGCMISAALYGVTCIQTFHYYRSGNKDGLPIRLLVLVLLILDSTHQALITYLLYHYLVSNFADPLALLENIWTIGAEIIVNAAIAFLVESFLVARIWILSHKNIAVTGLCGTLTVAHLVMNLVFPIRTLSYEFVQQGSRALQHVGTGGLSVAVAADVSISASLCFYLQRGRTGFHKTNSMITKLIALTITTGFLTTAVVIANLIALVVAPDDLYSIFFNFQLAKLYINIVLTSLNARDMVRNAGTGKGATATSSTRGGTLADLNYVEFPLESMRPSVTAVSKGSVMADDKGVLVHVDVQDDNKNYEANGRQHSHPFPSDYA